MIHPSGIATAHDWRCKSASRDTMRAGKTLPCASDRWLQHQETAAWQ